MKAKHQKLAPCPLGPSPGASAARMGLQLRRTTKDRPPLHGPDTGPGLGIRDGTPAAVGALRQGSGSGASIDTADRGAPAEAGSSDHHWSWRAANREVGGSTQCSSTAEQLGHQSSCVWACLGVIMTKVPAMQHAQLQLCCTCCGTASRNSVLTQPGLATNLSQRCCTDTSCGVRLLSAHMRTSASLALSVAAASRPLLTAASFSGSLRVSSACSNCNQQWSAAASTAQVRQQQAKQGWHGAPPYAAASNTTSASGPSDHGSPVRHNRVAGPFVV